MQKNIFMKDFIYLTIIFLLTIGIYFLHVKNSNLDFLLNQNTNQIEELQTQINMLKEEIIKKSQVEALVTKTISVESQTAPVSRGYNWVLFAFIGLVLTYKVFSLINLYYIPGLFWNVAVPDTIFNENTGLFIKLKKIEGSPFYDCFIKLPGKAFLTFDEFLATFAGQKVPDAYSVALKQALLLPRANLDADTWSFIVHSRYWPGGSIIDRLSAHTYDYCASNKLPDHVSFTWDAGGIAKALEIVKRDPDLVAYSINSALSAVT